MLYHRYFSIYHRYLAPYRHYSAQVWALSVSQNFSPFCNKWFAIILVRYRSGTLELTSKLKQIKQITCLALICTLQSPSWWHLTNQMPPLILYITPTHNLMLQTLDNSSKIDLNQTSLVSYRFHYPWLPYNQPGLIHSVLFNLSSLRRQYSMFIRIPI